MLQIGDPVRVVLGLGATGNTITGTVRSFRGDGRVLVRHDVGGGELWYERELVDAQPVATTPRAMVRASDPETSRLAAAATAETLTDHQAAVLAAFVHAGRSGLIDHELEARCGQIQTSGGKRRLEIRDLGLVEKTGQRRRTPSNRLADVHRVTARGQIVHQARTERRAS